MGLEYIRRFIAGAMICGRPNVNAVRLRRSSAIPRLYLAMIFAVAGAVSAALAMATLHLAFRRLTSPTTAVVAALIGGTATATWRISADQLWPHGPAQLWLALGVLSLAGGNKMEQTLSYQITEP